MGQSRPLFLYFRLCNAVDSKNVQYKFLPMTGFELRTSGVGSAQPIEPQPLHSSMLPDVLIDSKVDRLGYFKLRI